MLSNKIKSSSGATILLALLFFLMCALAGSVVLAAGTASSGRIKGLKEQEQAYYRVTSAAELLRDEINGQSFVGYEDTEGGEGKGSLQAPGGAVSQLLNDAAQEIFGGSKNYDKTLCIEANRAKKELNTEFVYSMDEWYNISIIILPKNNEPDKFNQEYACTLEIPAAVSTYKTTYKKEDKEITREITTVSWQGAVITKNANIDITPTTTPESG